MIGKSENPQQSHLFQPNLSDFINPRHELCLLAEKIDWQQFEVDFASFYSPLGCPAKPIRLMVGLLAGRLVRELKRKLSAENLAKHEEKIEIYERVLRQKKEDKNKIY